uniref:IDP267 n=1 Tax=Arundo donax TaxID=35708 RepID=A0A0A9EVF8_ARUDO
MQLWNVLNR